MALRRLTAVILLLMAMSPAPLRAQVVVLREDVPVKVSTSQDAFAVGDASITFRVAEAVILPNYQDNAAQLARLAECVERFRMNIDSVTIIAFASPEGRYAFNQKLSARRARAMRDYLRKHWPDVNFGNIREWAGGPDFKGLADALEEDPDVPHRDEVMALVRGWDASPEASFRRLMALHDGESYAYIQKNYLPWQRNATTVIFHYDRNVSLYERSDSLTVTVVPFESLETGREQSSAPAVRTSTDTVNVVSVYVPPVNAGGTDAGGLLPPTVDAGLLLPPAVSGDAGVLPPGMADTTAAIPYVPRYVVEDPVVPSSPDTTKTSKHEMPGRAGHDAGQAGHDGKPVKPEKPAKPERPARPPRQPREPRPAATPFLEGLEPVAAFSTNLLYDAVTAINLAMEFPLSERLTGKIEGIFPWWTWNDKSNAFQVNHLNLLLQYWPAGQVFQGWHAGGGLGIGRYDIEPRTKGIRGWEAMVTLGGGYALPLSDHFILDFGLGLGSMYSHFDRYEELSPGMRAITEPDKQYLWFGPTDLHLSLIYLFTRKQIYEP